MNTKARLLSRLTPDLLLLSVSSDLRRAELCVGEGWAGQRGGQAGGRRRAAGCHRGETLCGGELTSLCLQNHKNISSLQRWKLSGKLFLCRITLKKNFEPFIYPSVYLT